MLLDIIAITVFPLNTSNISNTTDTTNNIDNNRLLK